MDIKTKIDYTERHQRAVHFVGHKIIDRLRTIDADTLGKKLGWTPDQTTNILLWTSILLDAHDKDKLRLLKSGVDPKEASHRHRNYAGHHLVLKKDTPIADWMVNKPWITWCYLIEAIIDFESAGLTKPDKPLNAQATVNTCYADRPATPYLNQLLDVLSMTDPNISAENRWGKLPN